MRLSLPLVVALVAACAPSPSDAQQKAPALSAQPQAIHSIASSPWLVTW